MIIFALRTKVLKSGADYVRDGSHCFGFKQVNPPSLAKNILVNLGNMNQRLKNIKFY